MSRYVRERLYERLAGEPPIGATAVTFESIEALSRGIADLFVVDNVTLDYPYAGHARLRGRFLCDLATCFQELRGRFEQHGFTPFVREEEGEPVLLVMPGVFAPAESNGKINLLLLIATILTTLYVGAVNEEQTLNTYRLWLGWPYSLSLLLILGAHELGHYFAARYHKVPVTLPYFIPIPFPPIGTMGAFIRLKAPIYNRRALLDIGAAGPLAGLIFAIPILIYGLSTSLVQAVPPGGGYTLEGNSILYALLKISIFGRMLPDAAGMDVMLNQVAWAGWVGLLVTGLNLFPVGQLDGGHVSYVLFGKQAKLFFWPVLIGLSLLALITQTATWGLWIVMLFFFGAMHAEPLDDVTPLDGKRRLIAIITLFIFIFVFVPIPLRIIN
jgi:membrane-associated protease RseP (regulator of RpoE activity)